MKTLTIVALLVIGAGVWIEYNKDSSFATVDAGSLVIGAGAGFLIGQML